MRSTITRSKAKTGCSYCSILVHNQDGLFDLQTEKALTLIATEFYVEVTKSRFADSALCSLEKFQKNVSKD